MAGLGETTALLAQLRKRAKAPSARPAPQKLSETSEFGENPGALRMLSYAPAHLAQRPALVVVLHGCGQDANYAADAGWLTLADRHGFAVVAPEQTSGNNFNRCFNWFEPGDIVRGHGEVASIRAMVDCAIQSNGLCADRVFVTGLSAGGAMASALLAAYPDVFAGGGVIAGLPYGVARNVAQAFGAMQGGTHQGSEALRELVEEAGAPVATVPRVSIWHGDADITVNPRNATEIAHQWAAMNGLQDEPTELEVLPGRTRAIWRSQAGEPVIESNLIHGLGHGTPLLTTGPDALGATGPYMLQAGVSSSLEIARFWGIAEAAASSTAIAVNVAPSPGSGPPDHQQPSLGLGDQVMASVSPYIPAKVGEVIAGALKRAGLLR